MREQESGGKPGEEEGGAQLNHMTSLGRPGAGNALIPPMETGFRMRWAPTGPRSRSLAELNKAMASKRAGILEKNCNSNPTIPQQLRILDAACGQSF